MHDTRHASSQLTSDWLHAVRGPGTIVAGPRDRSLLSLGEYLKRYHRVNRRSLIKDTDSIRLNARCCSRDASYKIHICHVSKFIYTYVFSYVIGIEYYTYTFNYMYIQIPLIHLTFSYYLNFSFSILIDTSLLKIQFSIYFTIDYLILTNSWDHQNNFRYFRAS